MTMGIPLPVHIVEVIFSKLSISNLPICRLVCGAWNDLVLNSEFLISNGFLVFTSNSNLNRTPKYRISKMHCVDTDSLSSVASFEFEIDDLKRISFHSSCNGLLFGFDQNQTTCAAILNPMSNQFLEVPRFNLKVERTGEVYKFGFGFSPKSNKYKLFRVSSGTRTSRGGMEVFRFGSHNPQWSLIHGDLPFVIHGKGAYLNGVVYWIARKGKRIDECVVYAVDVETENIESNVVLKLGSSPVSMKILPFNGTIYAVVYVFQLFGMMQVWRMQDKDSWVRDFVFDDIEHGRLVARSFHLMRMMRSFHLVKAFEDGRILVLIEDVYYCLDKMGRKMKVKTFDRNAGLLEDICHILSLNFGSLPSILGEHE